MGVLAATVGFAAVAGAAGSIVPKKVTAHVSPHYRKGPPFKYRTRGRSELPKICPSGTTNPKYCTSPPPKACGGKVQIIATLGTDSHLSMSGSEVASAKVR